MIEYSVNYTTQVRIDGSFDEAIEAVMTALEDEGFGVLADIDVRATFEEKLDREFRKYRILGACNPSLAADALDEELLLGALLPCNVVVYETDDGDVGVAAVDPETLVGIADNSALDPIAADVGERFDRVLDSIAA
jgi:uncharacterized protein (DUF302 family)